jgi:hypothetical protein
MSLLRAVSSGLTAVPFGELRSAETLFQYSSPSPFPSPYPTPTTIEPLSHNDTKYVRLLDDEDIDRDVSTAQSVPDHHLVLKLALDNHESPDTRRGDDWGLHFPTGLGEGRTVVARAGGLEKRGAFRGVLQMDCKNAPEVCKNAGFYQNCLVGAKGDYTKVLHVNGKRENYPDKKTPIADKARYNSGVSTSWSTPCRAWPFAQRFWHLQDTSKNPVPDKGLETDEWPMATMNTGSFNKNRPISLRCITHDENVAGSNEVMAFRTLKGGGNYVGRGKWKHHRIGPEQPLDTDDTYHVDFNFDSFPKPGEKDWKEWNDRRA